MALESALEQQKPTGSPEDWVEWFLHRVQQEPWALGGIVVMGMFILTVLSLVIFALLYGCCCSPPEGKQRTQKKDGVI